MKKKIKKAISLCQLLASPFKKKLISQFSQAATLKK
jgi:hypothetical protein